jgi:hypothetical protein
MEKSQSIKEIAKALLIFHTKVAKIPKTDTNPFFKSKYAALPSILEAIQIPLAESDLSFTQLPDDEYLTTILIHTESGEYIQSSYKMSPKGNDPQSIGSAITYARRYALGAILGLNIDEDDDGNKASIDDNKNEKSNKANDELTKPWLNLMNKDGSVNSKVETILQKKFNEGKSLDELKEGMRLKKSEEEYIIKNILGHKK